MADNAKQNSVFDRYWYRAIHYTVTHCSVLQVIVVRAQIQIRRLINYTSIIAQRSQRFMETHNFRPT